VTLTSENSPLASLIDSHKTNLLIKSVLDQNLRIFRELLKLPFDMNHASFVSNSKVKTTAADIAWHQSDHTVLFELLCANAMYPAAFTTADLQSKPIAAMVKLTADLHDAIKNGDQPAVIEILQQNSNLRHFYDTTNASAVTAALKSRNIALYRILIDHDIAFGPHENVTAILKTHVPEDMRAEIRDLNSSAAKCLADRHLMTIFAKSVMAYDNRCSRQATDVIKRALRDLNEIQIGRELLQLSAHNDKLKIHFDFNQRSIVRMDPAGGSAGTSGMFYAQNSHVYVAAKDSSGRDLMAVLAHELCHLAVNLVFRNGVDPWASDDEERKKQFGAIIGVCQGLKDSEDIVRWVFECYL
jgi:hypothetical protein